LFVPALDRKLTRDDGGSVAVTVIGDLEEVLALRVLEPDVTMAWGTHLGSLRQPIRRCYCFADIALYRRCAYACDCALRAQTRITSSGLSSGDSEPVGSGQHLSV
jgi:hypothetical protein